MEKKVDSNTLKALAGALLALFVSIGLFVAANAAVPFRQFEPGDGPAPAGPPDSFRDVFLGQTLLSLAMLALSCCLFFIYLRDYLQLKSRFTMGLMLMVFSFMLFAAAANPLIHVFFGVYGRSGPFQVVPYLFATISLAILVWVSSK
jgi:hypothetical protein